MLTSSILGIALLVIPRMLQVVISSPYGWKPQHTLRPAWYKVANFTTVCHAGCCLGSPNKNSGWDPSWGACTDLGPLSPTDYENLRRVFTSWSEWRGSGHSCGHWTSRGGQYLERIFGWPCWMLNFLRWRRRSPWFPGFRVSVLKNEKQRMEKSKQNLDLDSSSESRHHTRSKFFKW